MQRSAALLLAAALAAATPSSAGAVTEVDLELVLMVDVSRSMTRNELEIQRRGYAEAFRSAPVAAAVRSGLLRRVALAYVEWAGTQQVIVDWRLLEDSDDLEAFADALLGSFESYYRRTSISEALIFGAAMIEDNEFEGMRKVIDVSGDGPNNDGRPVTEARDEVLARGIVINGLPLLTDEGLGGQWHLEGLDLYYETCVIGGAGSFVVPVVGWEDFGEAVRRKLILEMAGAQPAPPGPRVVPAQTLLRDPFDCMIGEKMREQRQRYWEP